MRQYLRQNIVKVVCTLVGFYVLIFVDLGTGTFAEHLLRILTTPESEALAWDIYHTMQRLALGFIRAVSAIIDYVRGGSR